MDMTIRAMKPDERNYSYTQEKSVQKNTGCIGHLRGDGGTVDALDGLEYVTRNRHQGAGVAGRHGCLRLALLDLGDGDAHGRILLLAQRDFYRIVHGDDFGGRHDAHALGGNAGRFLEA